MAKKSKSSGGGLSARALFGTLALGMVLGAGLVAALIGRDDQPQATRATGREVPDFRGLVDTTGLTLKPGELRDAPQLVFFGFTHCPDVCPATLGTVAAAMRRMPAPVADRVHAVLITVDPANDSAQVLANYVAGFDERIHGLTGDPQRLQAIADGYGAVLGGKQTTDHTALLYLVSARGEVLRTFLPGASAEEVAVAVEQAATATAT
jgi:protein SCO1